jgi:hypothetical protein
MAWELGLINSSLFLFKSLHQLSQLFLFLQTAFIILLLCTTSCGGNERTTSSNENKQQNIIAVTKKENLFLANTAKQLLEDGDLVTRSDDDIESLTLQNFSRREQVYSHSGIAFKENDEFVIYNAMGGTENPGAAFRKEPFDSFVNPLKKTGFAIFKYQLSGIEIEKLHRLLKSNYTQKIPFDISFNLKSNDSLYCSEMIYKGLKEATGNRIVLPSSVIENFRPKVMGYKLNKIFIKKFEFIGIDDLYLNPFCKEITRVKYK